MRPELAAIMLRQQGVFRRQQALAHYTRPEFEQRVRAGTWVALRHGVYTTAVRLAAAADDARAIHLLHAAARRAAVAGDTLVSHESAAAFHRIHVLGRWPPVPRLTRHEDSAAGRTTAHGLFVAPVPPDHRVLGLPVTSGARTVADCARSLASEPAFVVVESALHLGLDRIAVLDVLDFCRRWPGTAEAREIVMTASPWSESPLESRHRLWFRAQGIPQPQQQRVLQQLDGSFVARVDFVWEQFRTVCEADGQVKYSTRPDDAASEQTRPQDPLWREKLREDAIRDVGLEVVRGYWSDGEDGGAALAERLRRAFARGLRATGEPAYRLLPPESPQLQPLAASA